jgi:hypothetical protein
MQTGHLASSHSFNFSLVSNGIFGEDRLAQLELHENGDGQYLSRDTERSLLSFGMLKAIKRTN